MLPLEVSNYINTLIAQNLSKLDIIQKVMDNFGVQFPQYSFRKWCNAISDLVDNFEKATPSKPSQQPILESRKTSCIAPSKSKTDLSIYKEINFDNLSEFGTFRLTFEDKYSISKYKLIDLFKNAVFHIGPMRIKELNIKVANVYLISYVRTFNNKDVQYPLYSSCYLYVKLSVNEMVERLYDILQQLSIKATLEKGNCIIFKSGCSNEFLQKTLQSPIVLTKEANQPKVDKPTINPTTLYNHPDIIPPTPSKPTVNHRDNSKSKSLLGFISEIQKIRVSNISGQNAPHKPIFILTLIELIRKGHVTNNQFRFDMNMTNAFVEVWNRHNNRTVFHTNIASPFVSLTLDGFWSITQKGSEQKLINTISWIKRNVEYGSLDPVLYTLLQDKNNRMAIKQAIIEHFSLKQ